MNIIYYVACSVDGFIADADGGVGWLDRVHVEGEDYGYAEFFSSIDGLVFGSRTYEQVLELGPWPYGDLPCRALSARSIRPATPQVRVTTGDPRRVVDELRSDGCREVWLVGGGTLAGAFHERGLITRYVVTVIPTVLGRGVPLMTGARTPSELELVDSTRYPTGVVQNRYTTLSAS